MSSLKLRAIIEVQLVSYNRRCNNMSERFGKNTVSSLDDNWSEQVYKNRQVWRKSRGKYSFTSGHQVTDNSECIVHGGSEKYGEVTFHHDFKEREVAYGNLNIAWNDVVHDFR